MLKAGLETRRSGFSNWEGATACEGMTVAMERQDDLFADHLAGRRLDPDRLEEVLSEVLDRRQERSERCREHIAELKKCAAKTELRLKRLYDAIERGAPISMISRSRITSTD